MKMFYLNDEQRPMRVRILDERYDPATATGDIYLILQAGESRVIQVVAPANHVLYVKKWKDLVMISHIDPAVLAQLEAGQRRQEEASEDSFRSGAY